MLSRGQDKKYMNSKKYKHAFLIGVYQNPDYASELVESLRGGRSNIYVHINPRYLHDFEGFIVKYSHEDDVTVIHTQPINWGGTSLLHSILDLLELAMQNPDNGYFHMLTGQDILIKPLSELYQFFDANNENNYLSYGEDQMLKPTNGYLLGLNRSQYYHLFDKLNYRNNMLHRQLEKYFVKAQQLFHLKRKWPFPNYYQGSGWFSLNRLAVKEIMDWLSKNHKVAEYTFAPDEVILQSILLNSKTDFHIANDNLRLILWDNKGVVGSPVVLTEQHYGQLIKSHSFFARKIDPMKSKQLIEMIHNHIKESEI